MSEEIMLCGFYWGTLLIEIEGERSGVVFVKDNVGYLNGFALKISAFNFGPNPEPIGVPQWLIDSKQQPKPQNRG